MPSNSEPVEAIEELQDHRLPAGFFFAGQGWHLLFLAGLLLGTSYLAAPALDGSTWCGITDTRLFHATLAVAILHQGLVWLVFRTQLVFSGFSRLFGKYDLGVWLCIFYPLLVLRPLSILALGLADLGSLGPWRGPQLLFGTLLLLPVVYTGWSVQRYFGLLRAAGGDHFRQHYRDLPLVREGAFQYSSNAMYTFGFLLFWSLALLTGSRAALAVAFFQHAYIWVHYLYTEAPDMRIFYPPKP